MVKILIRMDGEKDGQCSYYKFMHPGQEMKAA